MRSVTANARCLRDVVASRCEHPLIGVEAFSGEQCVTRLLSTLSLATDGDEGDSGETVVDRQHKAKGGPEDMWWRHQGRKIDSLSSGEKLVWVKLQAANTASLNDDRVTATFRGLSRSPVVGW